MNVTYINHCGDDLSIVNAARVSFKKTSYPESTECVDMGSWVGDIPVVSEKDERLINFLAREKHLSPFNHTFITCHVKAPIFVARQLQKHEYMPWNEVSRRYVTEEIEFYEPDVWRKKADNVKQGSSNKEAHISEWGVNDFNVEFPAMMQTAVVGYYEHLINEDVAPEQARMILPQSTFTEWFWSGTLGAWAKMYNLRADSHAQRETQEIAHQAGEIIEKLFPVSWKALTNANTI